VVAVAAPGDSVLFARQRTNVPVRLDCLGRPVPGLASAWSRDSTGRTWTLTLADAGAVATLWHTSPDAQAALRFTGVESVVPVDAKRLVVTFRQPHDSLPALFADAALSLPRDSTGAPGLRAMPVAVARDAIDRGADIVRSADPTVLDYAARHPGSVVAPLPWDRTYVVIIPPLSPGLGPIPDTASIRAALATDAVHAEARAAEGPFWWTTAECAKPLSGSIRGGPASSAVVYPRDDEVARALAARLIAMSDSPDAVARAVDPSQLAATLRAGTDRAYVFPLPRRALVPCREMAGWPQLSIPFALIDTRARLILREGVPPLEVEYDGALRPVATP
jgi:hypothetical protein